MIRANLSANGKPELWWESDPAVRVRSDFPINADKGSRNIAVVYFELEPGCKLGRHTDSAEELLVILEGTVEATVGDETGVLAEGEVAIVPEMVPHSIRNVGDARARVAGVFPSGHLVATFDQPYEPIGQRVFEF